MPRVNMDINGFIVPPSTAILLAELSGRSIHAIKAFKPFSRLHFASNIAFETAPFSPTEGPDLPLTIGSICQTSDAAAIFDILKSSLHVTRHFAFVVDSSDPADAALFLSELNRIAASQGIAINQIDLGIACSPLNRKFATQRNRLQTMAKTKWVLQLDTDERLPIDLCRQLPLILANAEKTAVKSIGFSRANYVDGQLTASWPDIQFRLNRKKIKYVGNVHEAPEVKWWQQSVCLCSHLMHFLNKKRLPVRQKEYEAISQGGGRPHDRSDLETPYAPLYEDDMFAKHRPALQAEIPTSILSR